MQNTELDSQTRQKLIEMALDARRFSYSPYSHYKVGATLLCENGEIFTGCNVENASYPCGICGEGTALAKAVSSGNIKFKAIVIAGSTKEICTPCGMCRQSLLEFNPDLRVICCSNDGNYKEFSLRELLPYSFESDSLK